MLCEKLVLTSASLHIFNFANDWQRLAINGANQTKVTYNSTAVPFASLSLFLFSHFSDYSSPDREHSTYCKCIVRSVLLSLSKPLLICMRSSKSGNAIQSIYTKIYTQFASVTGLPLPLCLFDPFCPPVSPPSEVHLRQTFATFVDSNQNLVNNCRLLFVITIKAFFKTIFGENSQKQSLSTFLFNIETKLLFSNLGKKIN